MWKISPAGLMSSSAVFVTDLSTCGDVQGGISPGSAHRGHSEGSVDSQYSKSCENSEADGSFP